MLLYLVGTLLFSVIQVGGDDGNEKTVEVFILSNGVHTDIVLPVKSSLKDLSQIFPYSDAHNVDENYRYLGFGWGDKGFYLETETWADLKFSTAFKAATGMGGTAMHVTWYNELKKTPLCKPVMISDRQYEKLLGFILSTFRKDASGSVIQIKGHSYGSHDAFYEAFGSYSLFRTCNTWANEGLKSCGMKACLWTPLDKGILYHYQQ